MDNAADENWRVLLSLFPRGWDRLAFGQGAVERLRGFPNTEALLRTVLLHVGKGYSLRETAVQAELAGLAQVSDVTILNRLRQAEGWLHRLCQELLHEMGMALPMPPSGRNVRLLDGTLIQEPGRTGSSWRIHYSLRIPSVLCDHLQVTSTQGTGTGETLRRFPAAPGDLILADRGFCKPDGIAELCRQGADVIVRVNTGSLPLRTPEQKPFALLERLRRLQQPGDIGEWPVNIPAAQGGPIGGRLCAVRKSQEAIRKAQRRIQRKAQQGGPKTKPETLEYACYVVVFTTLTATDFPAAQVLEWYRLRWQVELVFKRLKQLAGLGHLPKSQDDSARAWLYGKLLVALLTQKLIYTGRAISPWGYCLPAPPSG